MLTNRLRTLAQASVLGAVVSTAALAVALGPAPHAGNAASHRESPAMARDNSADISDFFMFRSYEAGKADRLVLLMNVNAGQEPSSGPNYWSFDPQVRYGIHVDNNKDGIAEDISFYFTFTDEFRGVNDALGLPLAFVAVPPITDLDGPNSQGLGARQKYSVIMVKGGASTVLGSGLIAVPANVGPRTTPNYEANLAAEGAYTLPGGVRVFAGQRQDPFYIDLGGVFDTLNLRRTLPLLTTAEDADDTNNPFGVDMLSGFNVSTIALEVPISMLTADGGDAASTAQPRLGAYANTSRRKVRVLREPQVDVHSGPWIQVQRLANPLINEVIIGTEDKDRWNALEPEDEATFLDYYLNPRLATALQLVYGVPAATANRIDLVNALLKYEATDARLSELLRLNLRVGPTAFADQKRLGPLAHNAAGTATPDPAAWPNGRRPKDDVTDVAVRLVGGNNYINGLAGDGVNTDDASLGTAFPFLATPADGRNRVHQSP